MITLCTMNHLDPRVWPQWHMPLEACPAVDLSFPGCETAGEAAAEERIFNAVERLCRLPMDELRCTGIDSARWIERNLSPQSYARFLKENVFVDGPTSLES
jgi:hypothetical protein